MINLEYFKNQDIKVYAIAGKVTPATHTKNSRKLYKVLIILNNKLIDISEEIYNSGLLHTETITNYKNSWLYFQNSSPREAIDQLNKLGFNWVFCQTF